MDSSADLVISRYRRAFFHKVAGDATGEQGRFQVDNMDWDSDDSDSLNPESTMPNIHTQL